MRSALAILVTILLWGCAATATQPEVANDHPGSPTAMEAPVPTPSLTLQIESSSPRSVEEIARPTMQHDHGSMPQGMSQDQHNHSAESTPVKTPSEGTAIYTCPMHPEVQSAEPGRCPKCGMKLVLKKATEPQQGGRP